MESITVRAAKACQDNRNCLRREGEQFSWSPRIFTSEDGTTTREKLPSYLEPVDDKVRARLAAAAAAAEARDEPLQGEQRENAILAALGKLDPSEVEDWTHEGLPRMDRVTEIMGDDTVTRAEVQAVAPAFVRPPSAPAD